MRTIKNIVKGKKQALIVDNPFSVAMSMLLEEDVNKEVGFIFQNFQLLPTLTALENVSVPLELQGGKDATENSKILLAGFLGGLQSLSAAGGATHT